MSVELNLALAGAFLVLAVANTFLMYHLWGYPFDHGKLKSSAPAGLMRLHRALGWIYAAIYIVLISQMAPRLWRYQVEFPARTVVHLMLGMTIGSILVIKIAIVRFFKHLEVTLAPFLGTFLLICTVLMLGLSVPFSLRAIYLQRYAAGGSAFSDENLSRLRTLVPLAGFSPDVATADLTSIDGLRRGKLTVMTTCVQCHDLRTILSRPRTPEDWVATVERMGDRATVLQPIDRPEQWFAAAYLIAISPDLQKAVLQRRAQASAALLTRQAATAPAVITLSGHFDLLASKQIFELNCMKCHALSVVTRNPPTTDKEVSALISQMVDNGLTAPQGDLEQIAFYLRSTYVKK